MNIDSNPDLINLGVMRKMPMAKKSEVKGYFERVAPEWDKMRESFFDEKLRDAVIQQADIKSGFTVLDAGTGTGFMAIGAAVAVGKNGKVIGVDLSEAMLAKARENLEHEGLARRVELRVGDLEKLPVEDGAVDAVICNMGLHHCPSPQKAIKEMVRVLKPRGRLVISDLEKHGEKWLRTEMADVWLGFDLKNVENMLRKAGLRGVQVKLARTKCCGMSIGGRRVTIGIFVAEGCKPS